MTTEKAEKRDRKNALRELYAGLGFGVGISGASAGISASATFDNSIGLSISRKGYSYVSKNLPADYQGWIKPHDGIVSTSLRFVFSPVNNPGIGIEIGPALIRYQENVFTKREITGFSWLISRNYDATPTTQTLEGISIRTRFEFGSAKHIGGEFAILANINAYKPLVGIELYLIIGRINSKKYLKTLPYN